MKLPRTGCSTSSVFDRFGTGSVGLVVSGGEVVDVFGFDRFRLTRFAGAGGEVVVVISMTSGSTFFSLRTVRFDCFLVGSVVEITSVSFRDRLRVVRGTGDSF